MVATEISIMKKVAAAVVAALIVVARRAVMVASATTIDIIGMEIDRRRTDPHQLQLVSVFLLWLLPWYVIHLKQLVYDCIYR